MSIPTMSELNKELVKLFKTGELSPKGDLESEASIVDDTLNIQLKDKEGYKENFEAAIVYWGTDDLKPLFMHEVTVNGGHITLENYPIVQLKISTQKSQNIRLCLAMKSGDKYICSYISNSYYKDNFDEKNCDIGKLANNEKQAFVAYWSNKGRISFKYKDLKEFEEAYYRCYINGYNWENGKVYLSASLPMPRMTGELNVEFVSMSDGIKTDCLKVEIAEDKVDVMSRNVVFEVDFSRYDGADAYKMVIRLEEQSYRVYALFETNKKDYRSIISNETKFSALPIKEANGLFSIQLADEFYPYMISIITAVYNTKPFLHEMISSVLKQKIDALKKRLIGFEAKDYSTRFYEDIYELILVDDGATDGSAEILDDYAMAFDNVKVIHKENGGVSSARNIGIENASGKYINFADSDDKLTTNFLQETVTFFESHEEEIDLVTTPVVFFDAAKGDHWTNYKFQKKNSVVELSNKPDAITLFVGATVFKKATITNLFDISLVNGEDIEFIYGILNRGYQKIGAVSECQYLYRRRSIGEPSAIDGMKKDPRTYSDYLDNVLLRIIKNSMLVDGSVPKYVQYNVMGQLQWRFNQDGDGTIARETLGDEGYEVYRSKIFDLLKYIDDDVIMNQQKIWNEVKYFVLKKKHNVSHELVTNGDLHYFSISDNVVPTALEYTYIMLQFMEIKDGMLRLEGYEMTYEPDVEFVIYVDGEAREYKTYERDVNKYSLGEACYFGRVFVFELPLDNDKDQYEITFGNIYQGETLEKRKIRYTSKMPIAEAYSKSYYAVDNWIIRKENNALVARNSYKISKLIDFEGEFVQEVSKKHLTNKANEMLQLRSAARQYLASNNRKRVWLFSDRVNVAGDNGEALFKYAANIEDKNIHSVFVIDEDSIDFERLHEIGDVIARNSEEHLFLHLVSDCVISSSAEHLVFNPWDKDAKASDIVRDLLARTKFVFLQHGITKDDLSGWLNRFNKNIRGFICATKREAQSILDYEYFYSEKEVWLTGFPRHDLLYDDNKNKIVIMPTWRKDLSIPGSDENLLIPDFDQSQYCKFYNELINSEKLLDAAEKLGYKICFMPHPAIKRHGIQYFRKNDRVEFLGFDVSYRQVFAEASLIMTDYSSTVMDFVMLKKPVVYCQFDVDEFFENHTYDKGYYDYEQDGFGEVTYNLEACIDRLIAYMENGCKMYEPYLSRVDEFFEFKDKDNCKRVYEKIRKMDED